MSEAVSHVAKGHHVPYTSPVRSRVTFVTYLWLPLLFSFVSDTYVHFLFCFRHLHSPVASMFKVQRHLGAIEQTTTTALLHEGYASQETA
jgi:hypothetical protein